HAALPISGGHLGGAVLVVDDDVGVGVDDVGALGLDVVDRAGVKDGACRHGQAANGQRQGQKQCKKSFHVDNSLRTRYNKSVDFYQKTALDAEQSNRTGRVVRSYSNNIAGLQVGGKGDRKSVV